MVFIPYPYPKFLDSLESTHIMFLTEPTVFLIFLKALHLQFVTISSSPNSEAFSARHSLCFTPPLRTIQCGIALVNELHNASDCCPSTSSQLPSAIASSSLSQVTASSSGRVCVGQHELHCCTAFPWENIAIDNTSVISLTLSILCLDFISCRSESSNY